MSDPITVVTHTGLGERLKSSCTGIIFGIILFLGSFPLLFWNEQRAVARYDALREGEEQTISLPNATVIDSANEGKLVHFTAFTYKESDSLTDPQLCKRQRMVICPPPLWTVANPQLSWSMRAMSSPDRSRSAS